MRMSGKLRRKIWELGGKVGDKYNQSILYRILKELTKKIVARGREIYSTGQTVNVCVLPAGGVQGC